MEITITDRGLINFTYLCVSLFILGNIGVHCSTCIFVLVKFPVVNGRHFRTWDGSDIYKTRVRAN